MNKKNLLIMSENLHLLYLGENLIHTMIKKDFSFPLGFSSGQLNEKDNFLIYVSDITQLSREDQIAVSELYTEGAVTQSPVIIIGSYLNYDIKNIIKIISEPSDELLKTIFDGHKLQIQKKNKVISIQINHQELPFHSSVNGAMVLFNEEGIKYFNDTEFSNGPTSIADILKRKTFSFFWNEKYILEHKLNIEKVFEPELYHALKDFYLKIENDIAYISICNTLYSVQHFPVSLADNGLHFFEINDESTTLQSMAETSDSYDQISKRSKANPLYNGYTFGLLGESEKMNRIRYLLQKSSVTNTTILLKGESGTGKTYLAKQIHKCSLRQEQPFVHVNCAAIPYNLIESELFGYDEGAFTGAKRGGKAGYFEMAEGGTLFLDEITELPLSLQGKLLEVIQNKTYFRVGGEKKKITNVRLIVATNRNLSDLIAKGKFREDLYYRINVFPIELPPLRDRIESIFSISASLIPKICNELGIPQQIISINALNKMRKYNWPGNIRELENVIEKACILSNGKIIMEDDIEIGTNTIIQEENKSLRELRDDFEKQLIIKALEQCNGSKARAAEYLKIGKTNLFEKIKKYEIDTGKERNSNDY